MEMNRRDFMKLAGSTLAAHSVINSVPFAADIFAQNKKPLKFKNILFLLSDQQRQDCSGCYGNSVVQTPNLDRLAANGVRFTNAFTPTAVCCPARTSIQTGLLAHEHGIVRNPSFESGIFYGSTQNKHSRWTDSDRDPDPAIRFFSQSLAAAGWQLAHIGKWHIGMTKKPCDYGYENGVFYPGYGYPKKHEHYLSYLKQFGLDGFKLTEEKKDPSGRRSFYGLQEGPQEASEPAYLRTQTVDAIRRFSKQNKPFFISCNFWGPHEPVYITKKHFEMYKDTDIQPWPNFDCDLSDKPDMLRRSGQFRATDWITKQNLPDLIAKYYGYISLIDEEIGEIIQELKKTGQLEDTLIVYTTDHGNSAGSYRMWDKGYGMYDCLYRIPFLVSNPSIKPGVCDGFVSLTDVANTFLEISGCEKIDTLEGRSLMPIISGQTKAVRDDYIVCQGYGHQLAFWQRMVRTKGAKYIYNPTAKDEFYDLTSDPWETRNIIATVDRAKLKKMETILLDEMKRTQDPLFDWASFTI